MLYRENRRTGDKISIIGLGASSIAESGEKEGISALVKAFENGINYYDLAAGESACFPYYGEAFKGVRDKVLYQVHFGADYASGAYGWTTDLEKVKRSLSWQLESLKTDYIDYGFIHCMDELSDWQSYVEGGVLDYLLDMKKQGVVKHIGMSSHTPHVAEKILDTGLIDMMMFSINPAYDYQKGEFGIGSVDERVKLYQRCEREGVGISVMKIFGGGQLLDEKLSPFKKALTRYQLMQYALYKPGVLTILPGIRGENDLDQVLGFFDSTEEERDYSVIGSFTPSSAEGKCVYCNHCQPCPAGLDIAIINKYYDLAKAGDDLAGDHYNKLHRKASDCISCGHCDRRCPFGVGQSGRMKEIKEYFGA